MFLIDPLSRTPIYEQIIQQLTRLIESGVLSPGDQLPSVRALSLQLRINPNTIQKSYTELDKNGLITSVPGKGCFVSPNAQSLLRAHKRKLMPQFKDLAKELLLAGFSKDDLIQVISQIDEKEKPL